MLARYFSRRRKSLGFDLNSTSLKMIELSHSASGWRIDACAQALIPSGAIQAYSIMDADAITAEIQSLLKKNAFSCQSVICALPSSLVIQKKIQVHEALTESEREQWIVMQMRQELNYPLQDLYFDFQTMGASNQAGFIDVMVFATAKEHVETRRSIVQKAGLHVMAVDMESLALQRMLHYVVQGSCLVNLELSHAQCFFVQEGEIHSFDLTYSGALFCKDDFLQILPSFLETFCCQMQVILQKASHIKQLLFAGELSMCRALVQGVEKQLHLSCAMAWFLDCFASRYRINDNQSINKMSCFMMACGLALGAKHASH